MISKTLSLALVLWLLPADPVESTWALFERVPFKTKYFPELSEHFLVPQFDAAIRAREGKVLQIKGHYMPMDVGRQTVIISKYPYAACFFCGGAGPESVAEVHFKSKPPKFKADQVISVQGRLKLNDSDVEHLNFILEDAELVTDVQSKNQLIK
jgi:hypothetical protein